MGWSSGAELAEELWCHISDFVPKEYHKHVARHVVSLFEDYDCDNIDEARQLIKAARYAPDERDY
jgi:hypothetical protein